MNQTHDHHEAEHAHVTSISTLLGVFAMLMALTLVTVAATWIDLGPFNVWVAVLIAAVKGAVVALWYMHVKYDNPFFGQVLIASIFFVALFIGIALLDTYEYRPTIEAEDAANATAETPVAPESQ